VLSVLSSRQVILERKSFAWLTDFL
jgi:hypothetical protein